MFLCLLSLFSPKMQSEGKVPKSFLNFLIFYCFFWILLKVQRMECCMCQRNKCIKGGSTHFELVTVSNRHSLVSLVPVISDLTRAWTAPQSHGWVLLLSHQLIVDKCDLKSVAQPAPATPLLYVLLMLWISTTCQRLDFAHCDVQVCVVY